jgi:hypothetical protein
LPKVQRSRIPRRVLDHLSDRIRGREITFHDLLRFQEWLNTNPTVPDGPWFKDFGTFKIAGEGELIKTFLAGGMLAYGREI